MTFDGELLQRLFEDFINKVGQDKFNKDDKSKKVIWETMRRGLLHVVWGIGAPFRGFPQKALCPQAWRSTAET